MNRKVIKNTLKGFTLIELITVVSVITIMGSIAVPNILDQRRVARIKSENDQAYQVYVATQDYLNYLQKYGRKASDYFYKEANGYCFLVVDEGIVDYHSSLGALVNGDKTDDLEPRTNLNYAFVGICKRMGVDYSDSIRNDKKQHRARPLPEDYGNENARFYSPQLHDAGVSFAVSIDPDTYTCICAFATDFKTNGSGGEMKSGKDVKTDRVMRARLTAIPKESKYANAQYMARITASYNDTSNRYTLYDNGFAYTEFTGDSLAHTQEAATKYGRNLNEPMYMGQYPIGALK